ncbi:MAG: sulfatase-like hydrolase/transferase, partial [Bacteroidota bacterium]
RLAHLTPNLRKLKEEGRYFPMPQSPGSDWSSSAIYTSMSGLPAFFSYGAGGNRIFQSTNSIELSGVGHVLKAAGYEPFFLVGKKEFSGLSDMLEAFEFRVLSEKDVDTTYPESPWGLHDLDLFTEAKKQIDQFDQTGKSFAFFMATIGTHHPDGVYDPRVETFVDPQASNLETMAAALDWMVGDLIQHLESKGLMEETVFYLLPDHLMMGNSARVLRDLPDPRSLYLITNAASEIVKPAFKPPLNQVELPQVLLAGAEIEHNAVFWADQLEAGDIEPTLLANKSKIQQLNEASVRGEDLLNGFRLERKKDQLYLSAGTLQKIYPIPQADQMLTIELDHKFRIIEQQERSVYDAFRYRPKDYQPVLVIDVRDDQLRAAIRYAEHKQISKSGKSRVEFTASDLALVSTWPMDPDFYSLPKHTFFQSDQPQLLVTSSIAGNPQIGSPSMIYDANRVHSLPKRGLYLWKNGQVQGYHPAEADAIEQLRIELQNIRKENAFFVLIAHENGSGDHQTDFHQLGFPKLANLGTNQAYVAFLQGGLISEHVDPQTLSFALDLPGVETASAAQLQSWSKDVTRFIAHAGGSIDGRPYTNSLEALEASYQKGFRWFELDFLRTKDGKFVAAHDWGSWKQATGYKGSTPTDLATFNKYLIDGQYQAMDMPQINQWFADHPDAILVTDKVDRPVEFAAAFHHLDRLQMELFSWAAIEEAQKLGIEIILNEQLFWKLNGDRVAILQEKGIQKIAMSRNQVANNQTILKSIKQAGVQVFLYHLNQGDRRNEAYVLNYDLPYAYGMYADDWSFNN